MSIKKAPVAMFKPVPVGGGAMMFIQNPAVDPTICYALIYGRPVIENDALQASAVIESFDYLLSGAIPMKEATRRLRILRAVHKELLKDQQ